VTDEARREGEAVPQEQTAPEAGASARDRLRRPDEPEKGGGVGHRDLYAIIGIAVILFGIVVAFALLCPGAWETGQMMDDEPSQESQEAPEELEPPD
jgi:hypothetical protein